MLTFTPQADLSLLRAYCFYHTGTSRSQRSNLCLLRGPLPRSTRTSYIHQWTFPFWSLWLRVRTFLYFANGPLSIAKGPLHITCGPFCSSGPFIHNMPSSFPHTRTVFIHQEPVDFSMPQTFRVQTSLSTSGPFLLHALRARIVLFYKKRTLHIVNGNFRVRAGGRFLHNVRVRMQTDLIHCRNLSGSVLVVRRRLFSITRRPLSANHFLSRGPYRPQSVNLVLSRADRFHSRGPRNNYDIRPIRADLPSHKRHRRTFAQRARTFFV